MIKITNYGNMPTFLKMFLGSLQVNESEPTEVYDCSYQELIDISKKEHLEPQVLIDRKVTGRAFICALGASVRSEFLYMQRTLKPVLYFAELDEPRKKMFQTELNEARKKVRAEHDKKIAMDKLIKANTRKAAEDVKNK